jgi:7,8-dihydropterin-6-yl-methyl-4-(beta-D-ribofuranosyl)aminobenzene 5'-phosphate synthase
MHRMLLLTLAGSLLCSASGHRVQSLRVRILSTMLADDNGFGEWGFAALVEADGHKILFDTGAHPDTVLRNLRELKISLADVSDVILSHNHLDHTAGLLTLRKEFPQAIARAHTARGILLTRAGAVNRMVQVKSDYEAAGGKFIEYNQPSEIYPGVWLTGPVPRKYPEHNWNGRGQVRLPDGTLVEDNIPEDQSLIIDTDKGLVLISGCGHAGVINTLEYARAKVREAPVHLALGGFHLYGANDATLSWTATKLKEFGLQNLVGAHCTGIEAVYRLRDLVGLSRGTAVVGAVGAGFSLEKGIEAGSIAQ